MFILSSYGWAVVFCLVTMLCWGSWANTQKLASKEWRFELFYWDYVFGVVLISLLLALTMGSMGSAGRGFFADIGQADSASIRSALIGGAVFNVANILLVAAIAVAGMSVAFPVGIGLALVLGVIVNYVASPVGNATVLFAGVALIVGAIVLDALAYKSLPSQSRSVTSKGLILSVLCGVLMGFFYRFVAQSMATSFVNPEAGKLGPYTAVFLFSVGVLLSNFVLNPIIMRKPFEGKPVSFSRYFEGGARVHLVGLLGGAIWGIGMTFNIIASGQAGFAISYGLGQGATMVAALWGVFVWQEFKQAPRSTATLLALMFIGYLAGLVLVITARLI